MIENDSNQGPGTWSGKKEKTDMRFPNPFRWVRERKQAERQTAARAGRATSGHLNPGERARIFRKRPKAQG